MERGAVLLSEESMETPRSMSEEEIVEYLTERGIESPEAELTAKDADLWINAPELRYGFEDEEAVQQWRAAVEYLGDLVGVGVDSRIIAPWFNEATIQAPDDAHERALIAYARARERVRQAREEA